MRIARTVAELDACLRDLPQLNLVPTMGALHAGHLALVAAARAGGGAVAASIFVNPAQFAPHEDLASYPRDEAGDLLMLEQAGCDLLWLPAVGMMYPPGDATWIDVGGPALRWEGTCRPGHFRGVATVCAKLFGQVRPRQAFFGEKDWQQLAVVRRMTADLCLPLGIAAVPTVREADGLAMSSRNRRLTPAERARAALLPAALRKCVERRCARPALDEAAAALSEAGFQVDYLALVDGETLDALEEVRPQARIIAAARLGAVRLLDNMPAHSQQGF